MIGLIKEHQLPRDKVVIVGVPCGGTIDVGKVRRAVEGGHIMAPPGQYRAAARWIVEQWGGEARSGRVGAAGD